MPEEPAPELNKSPFVNRQSVLRALAQFHLETGFVPDDDLTIQEVRRKMVAEGLRPEDNSASREMIALRYPAEEIDY